LWLCGQSRRSQLATNASSLSVHWIVRIPRILMRFAQDISGVQDVVAHCATDTSYLKQLKKNFLQERLN